MDRMVGMGGGTFIFEPDIKFASPKLQLVEGTVPVDLGLLIVDKQTRGLCIKPLVGH